MFHGKGFKISVLQKKSCFIWANFNPPVTLTSLNVMDKKKELKNELQGHCHLCIEISNRLYQILILIQNNYVSQKSNNFLITYRRFKLKIVFRYK